MEPEHPINFLTTTGKNLNFDIFPPPQQINLQNHSDLWVTIVFLEFFYPFNNQLRLFNNIQKS